MTTLAQFRRGDTFVRTFTLATGWTGATFTEGVWFTLRTTVPESSEVSDDAAVYQASVSGGEITFSGAVGTITIPATETNTWPTGRLHWDLQGKVSSGSVVYTIDSGDIRVAADITRRNA